MSASGIVISRFDCEESRHRFYFWTTLRTLFCREYIGLCGSTYVFLPSSFHLKCFAGRRRVQHARPDHFAAARSELSVGDRLLRERAGAAYRHTSLGWESLVLKRQFFAIPSHAVAGFAAHPRPKLTKILFTPRACCGIVLSLALLVAYPLASVHLFESCGKGACCFSDADIFFNFV